ncbi:hypothetical protein [Roseovarius sp. MMSF_3281]|uniref:hypothetical protein n=1 Tax=Roseovarius sp. MMSF_3281 TaxID=3046694 RepID=UPI00273E5197|nr:hypothetical protein [Roseovarius sp. MMSF_3281]
MTEATVTLSRVRYAPEVPGFSALAHVQEAGIDYTYPVQMAAPLTAEFATISHALTRRGLSAHRGTRAKGPTLRLMRPAPALPAACTTQPGGLAA